MHQIEGNASPAAGFQSLLQRRAEATANERSVIVGRWVAQLVRDDDVVERRCLRVMEWINA